MNVGAQRVSSLVPLLDRAEAFPERIAVSDDDGTHTYADLITASERGAARLLGGRDDLDEARVAFMVEPSYGYVVAQWSTRCPSISIRASHWRGLKTRCTSNRYRIDPDSRRETPSRFPIMTESRFAL